MVSFIWPFALLLLPLPWLGRRASKNNALRSQAIRVPPTLGDALSPVQQRSTRTPRLQGVLLGLVWVGLVLAIAQPQWTLGEPITRATGRSIMLLMDLSGSMERRDFELDGEVDNRLNVVKRVVSEFIHARQGDRLGLILFGDEAFIANPLSFDVAAAAYALEESTIGMAGRTTALGDALGLALVKLQADNATDKAIVLLTDGRNNAGNADPTGAAEIAAQWGIRVHTVALGSDQLVGSIQGQSASAELDVETLKAVALLSGGRYFRVRSTAELQQVYDTLDSLLAEAVEAPPLIPREDIRHLPLLIALSSLLLLIALRQRQSVRA